MSGDTPAYELRPSPGDLLGIAALALPFPLFLAGGLYFELEPVPPPPLVALLVLLALLFLAMPLVQARFLVRVDEQGLLHRELVTRRIGWDEMESIRIARQTRALVVERAQVEVRGGGKRILVAWRAGKLEPLVELLRTRKPELIEEVAWLPEV